MNDDRDEPDLISLTADIVSAFVSNNAVKGDGVAKLIQETHGALAGLRNSGSTDVPPEPEFKPAVTVRKSRASREHIISMIDGKPYKTLKRHLARHGLTPAEYRERYGLPKDYPMVAPAYSEARRATALKLGLGQKGQAARAAAAARKAPGAQKGRRMSKGAKQQPAGARRKAAN